MKGKMKNIIYILLFLPIGMLAQEKEQVKEEPVKIKLAEKQILRKGNDLFKQKKFVDAEVKYIKALKENPNYEIIKCEEYSHYVDDMFHMLQTERELLFK